MFQVQVIDPTGVSEYFFTTRELVVASFALTYHAAGGEISYELTPKGNEVVFYTNKNGVKSRIGKIINLTIPGRVLNQVEHF